MWSKVYIIRKSVDKLKTELLFASTHHVRAGGKPVKFAEDGFKPWLPCTAGSELPGAAMAGRERGYISRF